MAQTPLITTGAVADHCHVTYKTVQNWIKSGVLRAARTPGGHNRIRVEEFEEFLAKHALPSYSQQPTPSSKKVLIVDDDLAVLKTMVSMVKKIGDYELATAANGFEAGLQLLKFSPDIIILDLFMPELNGFQVCTTARGLPETSDAKIIAVTASPSEEVMSKAFQSGADCCLPKPFKLQELKDGIESVSKREMSIAQAG